MDALETVRAMPWALETTVFGTKLHVMVEDEQRGRIAIVETLRRHGIPVSQPVRIVPSLEDVFLYLLEQDEAGTRAA